jgi:F-type H+-transporting ATPase subunit a
MNPNEIFSLALASSEAGKEGAEHHNSLLAVFVYFAFVLAIVFTLLSVAKKGFSPRGFKGFISQCSEQLYLFIENMCVGTIGAHGRKYIPFIITFWLVIFFSNVVALFFPVAPTADLSFNLGMALCSIGYVQYEGMKANGVFGHLKHFAGPKLGLAMIPITLMIFMIEVISEVMKNLSLTLRLFGNIDGGHQAAEAMSKLAGGAAGVHWIPAGTLLVPVKFLTCVVQAMIFCLLTCVYLSLVTHHEEEGAHAH